MALRVLLPVCFFIASTPPVIAQSAVPKDRSTASSAAIATSNAPGAMAITNKLDSDSDAAASPAIAPAAPVEPIVPAAVTPSAASEPGGFFARFIRAYRDDWHPTGPPEPDLPYRGDPAPVTTPPWPFTV